MQAHSIILQIRQILLQAGELLWWDSSKPLQAPANLVFPAPRLVKRKPPPKWRGFEEELIELLAGYTTTQTRIKCLCFWSLNYAQTSKTIADSYKTWSDTLKGQYTIIVFTASSSARSTSPHAGPRNRHTCIHFWRTLFWLVVALTLQTCCSCRWKWITRSLPEAEQCTSQ